MDYKASAKLIIEERQRMLDKALSDFDNLLNENSELLKIEKALRELTLNEIKGLDVDKQQIEKLTKDKKALIKKLKINTNPPAPRCNICNDTGFAKNQYCTCVKKLAISTSDNLKIALHKFSDATFSTNNPIHDAINKKTYELVEKIASVYPDTKIRNIVISGAPGTGKTFLAGCIADKMLEKGFSVLTITAFDFVNRALNYHTTFNDKKYSHLQPLIDCDFLIIDDLGTESILKNVTIEYLFMIISERIANKRLTMLTTNLTNETIEERYGERIYSRLLDKALSFNKSLHRDDIRINGETQK